MGGLHAGGGAWDNLGDIRYQEWFGLISLQFILSTFLLNIILFIKIIYKIYSAQKDIM